MKRGTTPTHKFTTPYNANDIDKVRIIYSQKDTPVITKENDGITFENNTIITKLSQEETLSFNCKRAVEIQIKILLKTGEVVLSEIIRESVDRCLDSEVL